MEGTWDQEGHTCTWNASTMVVTCDGEEVGLAMSLREAIIKVDKHLGVVRPWIGCLREDQ